MNNCEGGEGDKLNGGKYQDRPQLGPPGRCDPCFGYAAGPSRLHKTNSSLLFNLKALPG